MQSDMQITYAQELVRICMYVLFMFYLTITELQVIQFHPILK